MYHVVFQTPVIINAREQSETAFSRDNQFVRVLIKTLCFKGNEVYLKAARVYFGGTKIINQNDY